MSSGADKLIGKPLGNRRLGEFQKKARGKVEEGSGIRKGTTLAKKKASKDIERQSQLEKLRTAETESEIARRKASTKSGQAGRRSLIKSAAGLATNLGGTA